MHVGGKRAVRQLREGYCVPTNAANPTSFIALPFELPVQRFEYPLPKRFPKFYPRCIATTWEQQPPKHRRRSIYGNELFETAAFEQQ